MIYLSNDDVAKVLSVSVCIEALNEAFRLLGEGRAISRPRMDVRVPCDREDGYYRWGSMEGAIEPWGVFATRMKSDITTYTPQGTDELHSVAPGTFSGFVMVFSTRNGAPLAIMNDGILHHMRVAAGAALGLKMLGREDASILGMIGSGGMARTYLEAFCEVRRIRHVKVFSPTPQHRLAYATSMSSQLGIPVEAMDKVEDVVRGSDIVSTCTDSNVPVVSDRSWIAPGMHLANLGSAEWSWDIVQSCDRVVQIGTETLGRGSAWEDTERLHGWPTWIIGSSVERSRIPKRRVANIDFLSYPTLADIIKDPTKRRTEKSQVTFFHNLGLLGLQFTAIAAVAYQRAQEAGLGTPLSTAPFLQNIRD